MSLQATRTKIVSEVHTYMSVQNPGLAIVGDNLPYPKSPNDPWLHIAFIPGIRYRTNIGTQPRWRQLGILNVNVMVPEDTGSDACWALVDDVIASIEDKSYELSGNGGKVSVFNTDVTPRGILNGYWTVSVKMEFRKDSI